MAHGQGFSRLFNYSNNQNWFDSYIASTYADSNYFFVTGVLSPDSLSFDKCFVAKMGYNGNVLWQADAISPLLTSSFGGYSCMAKLHNGKYVVVAQGLDSVISEKINVWEPFLYFFDSNNASHTLVSYMDSNIARSINSITIDSMDNIIAAGSITSKSSHLDSFDHNYYYDSIALGLFKFNSSGNMIWQRVIMMKANINGNSFVDASRIINSADGMYYYITGAIEKPQGDFTQSFLLKTDTAGNVIWLKYIPHTTDLNNNTVPYSIDIISAATGGGYFVSCDVVHVDTIDQGYLYYGRFDDNGNILWKKEFTRHPPPYTYFDGTTIAQSNDGNFLLQGSYENEIYNPNLLKIDTFGNAMWYREYAYVNQFSPNQYLFTLSPVPDGRILMGGYFYSQIKAPYFDTAGSVSWIVLTDSLGQRFPGDTSLVNFLIINSTPPLLSKVSIYPNPVNDKLYINTFDQSNLTLQILDISGRILLSKQLQKGINVSDISQYVEGIYIAKILNNGASVRVEKILKN